MSGVGKKVADITFKAGRTIDWEGMGKLIVSDEARKEFGNLRRAFEDVNHQLQTKFSQVSFYYSTSICESRFFCFVFSHLDRSITL